MTPKQKRRLLAVSLIVGGAGVATALAVVALSGNVSYLYSPTAVLEQSLAPQARFRLGGVVRKDSVQRLGGLQVRFAVTDRVNERAVAYEGILPDLFREGQSVIAHGRLGDDGVFVADKILARHDETYMPREVMDAMERAKAQRDSGPGTRDPGNSEAIPAPADGDEVVVHSRESPSLLQPEGRDPGPGTRDPGQSKAVPAPADGGEVVIDNRDASTLPQPTPRVPGPGSRVPMQP